MGVSPLAGVLLADRDRGTDVQGLFTGDSCYGSARAVLYDAPNAEVVEHESDSSRCGDQRSRTGQSQRRWLGHFGDAKDLSATRGVAVIRDVERAVRADQRRPLETRGRCWRWSCERRSRDRLE